MVGAAVVTVIIAAVLYKVLSGMVRLAAIGACVALGFGVVFFGGVH